MKAGILVIVALFALALGAAPVFAEGCGCGKGSCEKTRPACDKCASKRDCKKCKQECECEQECTCAVAVAPKCGDAKLLPDAPQQGPWIIDPACCPRSEYTLCLERGEFELLCAKGCAKDKCECKKPKKVKCGCAKAKCGCAK